MKKPRISREFLAAGILTLTTIALAACLAAPPAHAQSVLKFTEWAVPTSSDCPFGLVAVSREVIYFTEAPCAGIAKVGKLNMATNTVAEWTGSALASPQGVVAIGSFILFADQTATTINMLDTETNDLTTWSVPTAFSGPLRVVAVGTKIFFTEQGGKIGMLDLHRNQITEWVVPGGTHTPLGIAATNDGSGIWFSQESGAQLGLLELDDNTFQQWTIPTSVLAAPSIQGIAVSEEDQVFFGDGPDSAIGQLDPTMDVITVWTTPVTSAPTQLQVRELGEQRSEAQEPFLVEFTDSSGNSIWRLLTALQVGTSTTVLPASTVVAPAVTPVAPSTSTLTVTSTVLIPTTTDVTGVITAGFEQWLVPTANSNTYAIAKLPGGGVAFTEANGNKIGTLTWHPRP